MTEENQAPVPRLWNINYLLLWLGQAISALGDVVYAIALGFWILKVTGSTALMGTLMAVSALPRVIVSPFAGVVVDRSDRKWLLISRPFKRFINFDSATQKIEEIIKEHRLL